jgi:type VI secretion system protein VasI
MRVPHLLALTVLLPAAAFAATDPAKEIARCAAIQGTGERLQCFDDLAKSLAAESAPDAAAAAPAPAKGPGKWVTDRAKNLVDDTENVTITLAGEGGLSRWSARITLIVRCQRAKTELAINWDNYLGSKPRVMTRIGAGEAETKTWLVAPDNNTSILPGDSIGFIKRMLTAEKFVAQVTPFSNTPVTAVFDTAGLDEAIKPVEEVCRWPTQASASPGQKPPAPDPTAVVATPESRPTPTVPLLPNARD